MAAATDYSHSVDERTNWSRINSAFDIFSFDIFLLSMVFYFRCFFGYYALRRKERSSKLSSMFVYICIGVSVISVSSDEVHNRSNLVLRIRLGFIATSDEDRSRNISSSVRILSWFIWWNLDQDPVQNFPRINISNL
jgi:hypothetical protein